MTDVLIASTEADAAAVQEVVDRHAELAGRLELLVGATSMAARGSDIAAVSLGRDRLVAWSREELVPYDRGLEEALYPIAAAIAGGALLVQVLSAELEAIEALVEEIDEAGDAVGVAAVARALLELVAAHHAAEDETLLPLLARTPGVSVAAALPQVTSPEWEADAEAGGGCGSGSSCGCGETPRAGHPELDATAIPHAIRHATIFGALDSVAPGGAMVLVAPHDPLPLLAQLEQRSNDGFTVEYLERGPETWRLLLTRRG